MTKILERPNLEVLDPALQKLVVLAQYLVNGTVTTAEPENPVELMAQAYGDNKLFLDDELTKALILAAAQHGIQLKSQNTTQ